MASDRGKGREVARMRGGQLAAIILVYLLIPALLWLISGDPGWWQAWVYSTFVIAAGLGGRFFAERRHPGLLAERMRLATADGVKPWDRVLAPLMSLSIAYPLYLVGGLDRRFGWTPDLPPGLELAGLAMVAAGYALASWAIVENPFFSSVARIQTERGHRVCDTGPYRFVRHPGYAGNVLALPGMALAFGSLWTLLPAAFALAVSVARTALEDRMLREELPGYAEYAKRVRFRLFPGIY